MKMHSGWVLYLTLTFSVLSPVLEYGVKKPMMVTMVIKADGMTSLKGYTCSVVDIHSVLFSYEISCDLGRLQEILLI